MATKQLKTDLMNLRHRLYALVESLRVQIEEIDAELRELSAEKPLRMDATFFDEIIRPLLAQETDGLFSADIRAKLKKHGIPAESSQLELFLTRYRDKGLLELVKQNHGPGRWKLKEP